MRTILITGASDGIGKSIAHKLSEQKDNLILFGRDADKLETVANDCKANGSEVATYAFDLCDYEKRQAVVEEVTSKQPIDMLINNAGVWHKVGDLASLTEDKIQEIITTNLTSQILLTRQLLKQMRSREGAMVLNIISKSALVPQVGQTAYTASKYGMKGFTDVLREDTKDEPIRIGAVYQAGTATDMFTKAGDDFPIERFTNPDDLADVVVFMLSRPEKLWINEIHIVS